MSEASSHKPAPIAPPESSSTPAPPGEGSGSHRGLHDPDAQLTVISSRPPVPNLAFTRGAQAADTGGLREGDSLGQFLLQKFVGGGGMGNVFRALDTTLNRDVAVKVLSPDQSADEETLRRFRNEAQSAARLNHDNIARVHFVGEDRGVHYIVFEFIEGVNIRDLVEQKGPLALEQAVSYTHQIALALEHASQRDVIHRDIKPSNVLITPDGKAKLVDMGLARLNQVAQADNDLTASGVTLGTFDYISPEQARDPRSADVRSDLYSLGCSFYYMLTGRPPFPDGTVLQKLLQHQADQFPDPRSVRPELPGDVTRILARLLAKNPAQRFQTPGALIEELAAFGEKYGMQLSSSRSSWVAPAPVAPARWQQHLPWMIPLAALFVIVLGLDFFWSSETPPPALLSPATKDAGPNAPATRSAPSASRTTPTTATAKSQPGPASTDTPPPAVEPRTAEAPKQPAVEPAPVAIDGPPPEAQATTNSSEPTGLAPAPLAARATGELNSQLTPPPLARGEELTVSAAAATASKSRPTTNPPKAAPTTDGVLVVSETEVGPRTYASLHAACKEARSGEIIELRFNGRRLETPLTVSNVKLTIRAGQQYQPVIVFRPEPGDPVKYPPGMLSVAGGELHVSNVHWELDLPRDAPAEWALVETRHSDLVRFEKCSFTILGQSGFHAGVAFFDVKAPPGTGTMAMDPNAMDDQVVAIELQDCIVRGEAALLRSNDLQPLKLSWDNGLLATSERLLVATGGPTQPRQARRMQLNLRHVTAMMHNGLALLTNSEDAPYQLVTEFNCTDSILVAPGHPPLVEHRGSDGIEEYLTRLQWRGTRTFYDGFDVYWQILNSALPTGSKQMGFDDWRGFWRDMGGNFAVKSGTLWKALPPADRPYHAHVPADYVLSAEPAENAARAGASDGADAGCLAKLLPVLPPSERRDVKPWSRSITPPPRNASGS